METKQCAKCKNIQPIENFRGNRSSCRDCERAAARESMRKRRKEIPEIVKEQKRKSYFNNLERNHERNRNYYLANREIALQKAATYRAENHQRIMEWQRAYRQEQPQKFQESDRKSYRKNRVKRHMTGKKYRETHSAEIRLRNRSRKVKIKYSRDQFTQADWNLCLAYWQHACAVCGAHSDETRILAADHWIPLNAGGRTDRTNIVPLCHGIEGCNNSKRDHLPAAWLTRKWGEDVAARTLQAVESYFASIR